MASAVLGSSSVEGLVEWKLDMTFGVSDLTRQQDTSLNILGRQIPYPNRNAKALGVSCHISTPLIERLLESSI